ncbi:MAG: hypothetical protein HKN43_06170 [Rhodothermales bacterium]|nr:hypothetical protein [Rhodothermales bacterium]
MNRKTRPGIIVGVLLLFAAGIGCTDEARTDVSMLSVEDLTYQLLPSGARIVSGTVYNPTESPMGSIQIQVSLFDKDNVRVDGLSILVRDLNAGSRVDFREPVNSDFDITAARVKGMIKL